VPARRRPKVSPAPTTSSPGAKASTVDADLERFAAAVRADEERKRDDARRRADAVEHQRLLDEANAELQRAIAGVRRAKERGSGRVEADEAWKVAKARVIELESGAPPSWAKVAAASPEPDGEALDEAQDGADDE
jgi:hypothetical protein